MVQDLLDFLCSHENVEEQNLCALEVERPGYRDRSFFLPSF